MDPIHQKSDLSLLLDFYGELLPLAVRRVLVGAVEEDLSLSEMSREEGISRQAVHARLQRGERELLSLEKRLGLVARWRNLRTCTQTLAETLSKGDLVTAQQQVQQLLQEVDR